MGFRNGAYATVWQVETKSPTMTTVRLTTSKKDKNTGTYETDFSGFVGFIGSDAAQRAAKLKERDRIKLGDVEVSSKYDPAKSITYTNFKCFSFEEVNNGQTQSRPDNYDFVNVPEGNEEEGLPF